VYDSQLATIVVTCPVEGVTAVVSAHNGIGNMTPMTWVSMISVKISTPPLAMSPGTPTACTKCSSL
jgi:hypothetical protein